MSIKFNRSLYQTRSTGPPGLFVVTRSCLDASPPWSAPHQEQPISSGRLPSGASAASLSVQEQSVFCVLNHRRQTCLQILPCDRTAPEDGPFVCLDCIQLQSLDMSIFHLLRVRV